MISFYKNSLLKYGLKNFLTFLILRYSLQYGCDISLKMCSLMYWEGKNSQHCLPKITLLLFINNY